MRLYLTVEDKSGFLHICSCSGYLHQDGCIKHDKHCKLTLMNYFLLIDLRFLVYMSMRAHIHIHL